MSLKTYKLMIGMLQKQSDEVAETMRKSQQDLNQARERLDQLEGFQEEYQEKFKSTLKSGLDIASMRNYQVFMDRLGESIKFQLDHVALCEERFSQAKKAWEVVRIKMQTYEKLVEREQLKELTKLSRRERKMEDELQATRQMQNKTEDGNHGSN